MSHGIDKWRIVDGLREVDGDLVSAHIAAIQMTNQLGASSTRAELFQVIASLEIQRATLARMRDAFLRSNGDDIP